MTNVARIQLAHELYLARMPVTYIAERVGRHRSTIHRWISRITQVGYRQFIWEFIQAKKGSRQPRKTDPVTEKRILKIRSQFSQCCGEKIQYWMMKLHGYSPSRTTIYRILGKYIQLRSKWKKNHKRGPVPTATAPHQVMQVDTVDFGGIYAFTAIDIFTRKVDVVLKPTLTAYDGAAALVHHLKALQAPTLIQRDGGHEFKGTWEDTAKHYAQTIRTARPYKKNEQAYIESFNRTLRKECLGWRKYQKEDIPRLTQYLERFLTFYNYERPHLSLDMKTPEAVLSHLG